MKKIQITMQFVTPAFLGDAEQKSAWRTPPLKALLRQWWRVAIAHRHRFDHLALREAEGRLFGHAWLNSADGNAWAAKSRVRMRLSDWSQGQLRQWDGFKKKVHHPEVGTRGMSVGVDLYLGFGPVLGTKLKNSPAIQAGASVTLHLGVPESDWSDLVTALQLIHWFGACGGRSRNGWGSISITGDSVNAIHLPTAGDVRSKKVLRNWETCLEYDWPHAIGQDAQGPLIWQTEGKQDWQDVMHVLASKKIAFRTQLKPGANNKFDERHVLAYPVTHHSLYAWGNQSRIANQLRFKIVRHGDYYQGVIIHVPCALPKELAQKVSASREYQQGVWKKVHVYLDGELGRLQA